ncbi:MAG: hypothetical protein WAZ94_13340 [Phycisphaerales bacterium]
MTRQRGPEVGVEYMADPKFWQAWPLGTRAFYSWAGREVELIEAGNFDNTGVVRLWVDGDGKLWSGDTPKQTLRIVRVPPVFAVPAYRGSGPNNTPIGGGA